MLPISLPADPATRASTFSVWRNTVLASPGGVVACVIVAGVALRLLLAVALGLGIDESYMVASGRTLQLGYFDHPPLSWWLSSATAQLAGSEAAWVVRLPFSALFAVSTWLMYRLGAVLFGSRAGMWAAVALNLSPVFGITTASWVLPDGPLDCALLAAALCFAHACTETGRPWRWWLGAGAAAGCALLSKYSAGLILAGALLYLLTQPRHRRWLLKPQPYVAALVALLLFSPVLLWNAGHGWASFAFQGGRAASDGVRLLGPLRVLAGEALFVLPWLWLPMLLAVWRGLRAGPAAWRSWLLCCLGMGPVALFAVIGLWSKHVLYHWAGPGYLMLFPLLGVEIERLRGVRPLLVRSVLLGTAGATLVSLGVLGSEVRWNWLPLAAATPEKDPAFQVLDWTPLREALSARGLLDRAGTVIGATGWQDAGKIGYALGADVKLICLNQDAREFGLSSNPAAFDGADVLIVASRPVSAGQLAAQGFGFDSIDELAPVVLGFSGRPGLNLRLFLGHGLHRGTR
jgi:Dolichyl-phosphate-mannose-protein mannosyltransferase